MGTTETKMSIVKYAGDYWVTLAGVTATRDVQKYSGYSSVKSAIRTFVVRKDPDKYVAFRGENQLKMLVQENLNNDWFDQEEFKGTRTALIHWSLLEELNKRFEVADEFQEHVNEVTAVLAEKRHEEPSTEKQDDSEEEEAYLSERSTIVHKIKNNIRKLEREIEIRTKNKEKLQQALEALESMDVLDN